MKKNQKNALKGFYLLHFDRIKKFFPDLRKMKTLEVGCQSAYFSIPFAKAGAECYCIDNEQKELEKGIELFKNLGLKAKFELMDGFRLKFKDNSFDLVFNHGVIEHFLPKKQDTLLQEMKRVSKKLVYVSVPNKWHLHSIATKKETEKKKKNNLGFAWEREFYPFSFRELKKLFERNDLKILELFGSLHWFRKNKQLNAFLQKTIGLLLGFELCALAQKRLPLK